MEVYCPVSGLRLDRRLSLIVEDRMVMFYLHNLSFCTVTSLWNHESCDGLFVSSCIRKMKALMVRWQFTSDFRGPTNADHRNSPIPCCWNLGSRTWITVLPLSQKKHQLDATLCRFYFCRVTLHVSGASAHHQEYLKLVQRPLVHVLSL